MPQEEQPTRLAQMLAGPGSVEEKFLSWTPSLLRQCAGLLLLNLREDEGQEEVLEDKDEEEEESEVDEKVKEVRENAQPIHATW